jgi:hypothetical protein
LFVVFAFGNDIHIRLVQWIDLVLIFGLLC